MGRFVKGDVVVLPFPFSDLTTSKKRPAVVVAPLTGDDVLVCQITSKTIGDSYVIPVSGADFTKGKLRQDSNIRPNRLFTADSAIILYLAGKLSNEKMAEVLGGLNEGQLIAVSGLNTLVDGQAVAPHVDTQTALVPSQ